MPGKSRFFRFLRSIDFAPFHESFVSPECADAGKDERVGDLNMGLIFKLSEISAIGLSVDWMVEPSDLDLSPDEGAMIGGLHCWGTLSKPDEATVYFQGNVQGKISRECVRCLSSYDDRLDLPCTVLFKKSAVATKGKDDSSSITNHSDEVFPIIGGQIDLLPALREHVILATPLRALCQEQCLGLCQVCGANLNVDVCECRMPVAPSEGVFHPDVTALNRRTPGRTGSSRHRGSIKKH